MLDARLSSLIYRIGAVRRRIVAEQHGPADGVRMIRLKALLLRLQLRLRSGMEALTATAAPARVT